MLTYFAHWEKMTLYAYLDLYVRLFIFWKVSTVEPVRLYGPVRLFETQEYVDGRTIGNIYHIVR